MRILMLAQFYPPVVGGEEQHVRNLSHALAARGHQVAVATLRLPGTAATETDGPVRVYRLEGTVQRLSWLFSESERPHAPPLPDPAVVRSLAAVLRYERPDVVHAHNWLLHSYLPLAARGQVPFVVTLHDYSLACAKKRLIYRDAPCSGPGPAKCLACTADHYGPLKGAVTLLGSTAAGLVERRVVDLFLAVSQATAAGNGLVGSNVPYRVVHNFIPDDIAQRADPADPRLRNLPQGDFLLFVGDLSRDKGVHVLLEAYRGLTDAPPLVLIGRRSADTPRGLTGNIRVYEKWPHTAVMAAWRRCLFGLVPSTWAEPCGTVVLEAMATGRAVIASRIGGLVDLVADEESGLLVPPGDSAALRQAMQRLLVNRPLRNRMGQAGQARVQAFFASAVVPQIEAAYHDVLAQRMPVRPPRNFETEASP